MPHDVLPCLLLSIAAGLSVRRFLIPYFSGSNLVETRSPSTIVATSVFLAALAFTVSEQSLLVLVIVFALGALLASIFSENRSGFPVALAVVSLGIYVGLR